MLTAGEQGGNTDLRKTLNQYQGITLSMINSTFCFFEIKPLSGLDLAILIA